MKSDLKSMSRKELTKLIADAQEALGKLAERERKAALEAAEKAALAHGYSLSDLTGTATSGKSRKPKVASVARYANPADGGQTWTGKGRQPQWFKDAIASGRHPESMAI